MNATETAFELTVEPVSRTKCKVTVNYDGTAVFVDILNVSSAKDRQQFVAAVAEKYRGIDAYVLDAELLKRAAPPPRPEVQDADEGEADLLAGTPQDIIDEVNELLAEPELVGRVCDAVALLGVAGERELVATLYLIGVSRLLPRPLAGIVRGSSSSGKSYTVEKVATLFPPEAVVRATQMTPQALFHMPPGSLVHRWVVAGERSRLEDDEKAEATRALREMLASGKLTKLMPVKAGNGIETQVIEQEGPISFVETTTLTNIFEEDVNRCLLLQTDESPEQTRRILDAMAQQQAHTPADIDRVVQVHHTLQRMLPRVAVRVPWLGKLSDPFPCDRVEVRRAFPQLVALIQASALLHHRQRDVADDGAILADARDYHLARRLIVKPFSQSLGGALSEPARAFLARLPTDKEFTSKSMAKFVKASKSAVNGWLSELHDAGAVELVEERRGNRGAVYRATGKTPEPGDDVLPSVTTLFPEGCGRVVAT